MGSLALASPVAKRLHVRQKASLDRHVGTDKAPADDVKGGNTLCNEVPRQAGRESEMNRWTTPRITFVAANAEIGSYQEDFDPHEGERDDRFVKGEDEENTKRANLVD